MMLPNDSKPVNQLADNATAGANGLLKGYAAAADANDEMWDVTADGVRDSWQPYIKTIGALGLDTLRTQASRNHGGCCAKTV